MTSSNRRSCGFSISSASTWIHQDAGVRPMSWGWPGSYLQKNPTTTSALRVDLNADIGESFGLYQMGNDELLLRSITSGSIACGFHAGDPSVMRTTVRLAARAGVAIGAHPGFPDLMGFGRREINAAPQEIFDFVLYPIGALSAIAAAQSVRPQDVKPHGALHH